MGNGPNSGFDMTSLQKFADSDVGRSIISLLLSADKEKTQAAAEKASTGDLAGAKQMIESMLSTPQIRSLLKQLGNEHGQ